MSFRRLSAVLAVALVAVALLVWQPWTGQLEGTVYFTECGGTEPANPPPGYTNCTTTVAVGSQVIASPAAGGSSSSAVAGPSGRYNLRLVAGQYYLRGITTKPFHVRGQGGLVLVSANATRHVDIGVALYEA